MHHNAISVVIFLAVLSTPTDLALAQPNKCVVNGKVLYTDGDCPAGAKQERPKGEAKTPATLPTLQRGLWKIRNSTNGNSSESEICGNPLGELSDALNTHRSLGCTTQISSPEPRTTKIQIDCPTDRVSANGSTRVRKGRMDITIALPSAQSFKMDARSLDGSRTEIAEGVREGSCE